MLNLKSISELKTEKQRSDNKVSRQYYVAEFADPSNLFAPPVKRAIWQQHNVDGTEAIWKGGDYDAVKKCINKLFPAEIVSRTVEPYDVMDSTGAVTGQATKYTTVVFKNETIEAVFKSAGRAISTGLPAQVASMEAIAANEAVGASILADLNTL